MELALITVKQVTVLFCLIFTGYLCVRTGAVKPEGKKAFSDLLLYLVVPAMVIHSYMIEFKPEILPNLLLSFGLSTVLILLGLLVTMIATKGRTDRNLPILRFACIFSNAAYMGFPLIQALFGAEGLIYASAYVTVFNILLWTFGYGMLSGKVSVREILTTILRTPVLLSVAAGLVIYLCRIPVPSVIQEPVSLIGNMNTPLSMFITGMIIAETNLSRFLKDLRIIVVLLLRMFVIPLISLGLFLLLGVHGMAAQVVLLLEACPCAAITSVFAVQLGYDEGLAAGAVVLSTFLSILTLPLCAMLLSGIV